MANEFLKSNILEIVDNQIKDNTPECTGVTLERLISLGYSDTQAREMIGAVLVEAMFNVLKYNQSFDEQEYAMKLYQLGDHEPYRKPAKIGRNDPCPCGSGKKYKKCCGRDI